MPNQPASRWEQLCAAAVHIYTATGVIWGFLMIVAAFRGDPTLALWANLVAQIVDGTDGALARRFRVRAILPSVDGGRLDDIVDYLTYVFAPIVLLWDLGYLPPGPAGIIIAVIPSHAWQSAKKNYAVPRTRAPVIGACTQTKMLKSEPKM